MDADDLRNDEDQFLDDFSSAEGPIAQLLAYLPGSMDTFQDGLLKAMVRTNFSTFFLVFQFPFPIFPVFPLHSSA